MKRILLIGLVSLIALPAFADLKGDMRRFYGLVQAPGDTPSANFTNPVSIGGIALTTNGLDGTTTGITAHAGGGQGSAVALTTVFNNVTTCTTAADSVKLLTAVAGTRQTVKNSGATALAVFPFSGDSINSLSANASVTLVPGEEVTFNAINSTVWVTTEAIQRSSMGETSLAKFDVPLDYFVEIATGGLFNGIVIQGGTDALVVKTADVDNTTATETAIFQFRLPDNYIPAQDVKFSMSAKYIITGDAVAGANNDIDVLAYEVSQTAGTVGADLCATSAIAVTSSYAVKLFTITSAGFVAGDLLKVTVNLRVHDSDAGAGTITSYILAPHFQCDVY